jgi:hypothetical protein
MSISLQTETRCWCHARDSNSHFGAFITLSRTLSGLPEQGAQQSAGIGAS